MKYLLVAVVVFIAFSIWRNKQRRKAAPPVAKGRQMGAEDMVVCAHCGVHLPHSDAVVTADRLHFCSAEHRRLGPR